MEGPVTDGLVFRTEGRLYPSATGSHLQFRLRLPASVPAMRIRLRYAPKRLEDAEAIRALAREAAGRFGLDEAEFALPRELLNLLTLSLDDADGFRGSAHRHDSDQELELADGYASPGLVPGAIPMGPFVITLSVHAVLSECCAYELSVYSGRTG